MIGRFVCAFWILFCFLSMSTAAQPKVFTGKITYENTYQSSHSFYPVSVLKASLGTHQTLYLYKGGFCKVQNQPLGWEKQWFDQAEGRLYFIQTGFDTLYWKGTLMPGDSILRYDIEENATEILGHRCHVLTAYTVEATFGYSTVPITTCPESGFKVPF